VAIARLLHAVAYEEIALARLMQAEVAKVERLTSQTVATPTFDEIIALQRSAADVVHRIVRKEEILLEKLNVLLSLVQAIEPLDADQPKPPGKR
jgi:hypothetical protein